MLREDFLAEMKKQPDDYQERRVGWKRVRPQRLFLETIYERECVKSLVDLELAS